jgi:hypothetical protein
MSSVTSPAFSRAPRYVRAIVKFHNASPRGVFGSYALVVTCRSWHATVQK